MYKGIIYCATAPNGKKYYGQTIQGLKLRQQRHKRDLDKGTNWVFYQALKKHGWENFIWEIIEEYTFNDKKELHSKLNEREKYWILENKTFFRQFGYNMTLGGDNYMHTRKTPTAETKEKQKKALIGRKHTEERRKNQSLSQIGKPHAQNYGGPRFGKDNPAYKEIPLEDQEKILSLYSQGFGSRIIERELQNKYSFIKILKFLREKGIWHSHKFDGNKNKLVKENSNL
jgi:group I intron endonuclease